MITFNSLPSIISPVYNPIYFDVQSTNTSQGLFKYVFQLYSPFNASTILSTVKMLPRPDTTCIYNPARILESKLSFDSNIQNIVTITASTNHYTSYKVNFGEEYQYNWNYSDYFYCNAFSTFPYTAFTANIGFTGSTPHYYSSGDVITITHQSPAQNPQFTGTWTVLAVPNPYQIITSITSATGSSAETGTTIYSDRRVTTISGLTGYTGYTFNGVNQYDEIPSWNYLSYIMTGTTGSKKFLTNMPRNGVYLKNTNRGTLSFFNYLTTANIIRVITYQNSGGTLTTNIPITIPNTNDIVHIPSGIYNINGMSANTINITRDYQYTVALVGGGGFISESILYLIDGRCSKYDGVRLQFLNRLGGYDYVNFDMVSRQTVNTTKSYFKKRLDYNYSVGAREKTVLDVNGNYVFTVNSNWMDDAESAWMEELLTSSVVNIIQPDGTCLPVNVLEQSVEIQKTINNKMIMYSFNLESAFTINGQRS